MIAAQKRANRLQGNLAAANPGGPLLPGMAGGGAAPARPAPAPFAAAPPPGSPQQPAPRSPILQEQQAVPWATPTPPRGPPSPPGQYASPAPRGGGAAIGQLAGQMDGLGLGGAARGGWDSPPRGDAGRAFAEPLAPGSPPARRGSRGNAQSPQASAGGDRSRDSLSPGGRPSPPRYDYQPRPAQLEAAHAPAAPAAAAYAPPAAEQHPPRMAALLAQQAASGRHHPDSDGEEDQAPVFHADYDAAKPAPQQSNVPVRQYMADMEHFLRNPAPRGVLVKCYIIRDREKSKSHPTYRLYLYEDDGFMLSAVKRKHNRTSNYMISLEENELSRDSDTFYGKLRANLWGTEFTIYDNGINPKKAKKNHHDAVRKELGAVMYQANVLGNKGPRQMTVVVPSFEGDCHDFQPMNDKDSLLAHYKGHTRMRDWVKLENKKPNWNRQVGAYVLNFNGRVTLPSIKNFQLISEDNEDYIILQFGKVGKDAFTMDYQWPMSALQAFAICMSSFDPKLACE